MLRPPQALSKGETTLAREKNTSRAEARRRIRTEQRAELMSADMESDELEGEGTATVPTERKPMFKMPNFREDIRALPGMFRSKPLLFLPFLVLIAGAVVTLALPGMSPDMVSIAGLFVQFFFLPPALFTFFLAGFFAPRAAYLVGFLSGVFAGVLWFVTLVSPSALTDTGTALSTFGGVMVTGVLYGTLAAALAAWYRDFLRGIQERGRAKRADRELAERDKRRVERQEARRVAKQRPTP
jgi:hypothetical protein